MAFSLTGAKRVERPTRAKGSTYVRILDRQLAAFNSKMSQSINEAKGRYGEGWEARAAGAVDVDKDADTKKTKAYAAPFWKAVYVEKVNGKEMPHPDTDIVELKLKVGNKAWPILPSDDGKSLVDSVTIAANTLIDTLEGIKAEFENMDAKTQKSFHELAIEVARPKIKGNYSYDKDEDRWISK